MRHYNQAIKDFKAADFRQGEALVIVHRGLALKDRMDYAKAIKDFKLGLKIAQEEKMGGIRQLKEFISETESLRRRRRG
jgi:tetratricopeptide (TPR) repeat protein